MRNLHYFYLSFLYHLASSNIDLGCQIGTHHHCQHHRHIGSGQWLNKNVSSFSSDGFQWVNDHNFGTIGSRLFDERPEVSIDKPRVSTPEQNQFWMFNIHWIIRQWWSQGERRPNHRGCATHWVHLARCTNLGEKASVKRVHLDEALCASRPPRQNSFSAEFGGHLTNFGSDQLEGFIPRGLAEFTRAFGACSNQRIQDAIRTVDTVLYDNAVWNKFYFKSFARISELVYDLEQYYSSY